MTLENKTPKSHWRKQCVHWKTDVEHLQNYDEKQPDCMNCDGHGQDAIKYDWECYNPYFKWLKNEK